MSMTRREVLAWLGRAATLGAAGCAMSESCGLAFEGETPAPLANLTAIPMESARDFVKQGVIVVRTTKGLAAFPNICTHRHNELSVDNKTGAIFCEVHGSQFSLEGKPLTGPASRSLKWLKVSVDEQGGVFVDLANTINSGTWTAPPEWAQPKK